MAQPVLQYHTFNIILKDYPLLPELGRGSWPSREGDAGDLGLLPFQVGLSLLRLVHLDGLEEGSGLQ